MMSGFVYKITCNDTNECYVGSTIQSLKARMASHRSDKSNKCISRTIIDRNKYVVEIIEVVNFGEDKNQLLLKEREWIEKLNAINNKRPIVSKEEATQRVVDINRNRYKTEPEYKQRRDDAVKAYRQTDVGKQKKQEQDKKYREGDKREKLLEQKREWSRKNREETKEKRSKVIDCECGFTYTLQHKARHEKSKRHCEYIN